MEARDPADTPFSELEVIRITVPRVGAPVRGPFRGAITHILRVSRQCAEEIEAKLEQVHPEGRVSRPRIYRGERELDPPRVEDDDAGGDLAGAGRELDAHRQHIAMLQQQAAMLQQRIAELTGEAERAAARRDSELAQLQRSIEHTAAHAIRVATLADQHVEAALRRTFDTDAMHQAQRAEALNQFASSATAVRQAREVLDGFLTQASWTDVWGGIRDTVTGALDSDLGKLAGMQLQTVVAARVAKYMDLPDVSAGDVLAATVVSGAKFRASVEGVQRWAALHSATVAGQTAGLVVNILRGDVGLEALEDLRVGGGLTR